MKHCSFFMLLGLMIAPKVNADLRPPNGEERLSKSPYERPKEDRYYWKLKPSVVLVGEGGCKTAVCFGPAEPGPRTVADASTLLCNAKSDGQGGYTCPEAQPCADERIPEGKLVGLHEIIANKISPVELGKDNEFETRKHNQYSWKYPPDVLLPGTGACQASVCFGGAQFTWIGVVADKTPRIEKTTALCHAKGNPATGYSCLVGAACVAEPIPTGNLSGLHREVGGSILKVKRGAE